MLNLAVIMGRLTRDPELRQTPNGVSTTTISVAVDRDYKKDGQDKETDFLDVVAWRSTAEFICNNFSKGQMIALYGRLQKRSYEDANGNKRTVTEVIADSVYFCGPKMQQNSEAPAGNGFDAGQFAPVQNNGFTPDFSGFTSGFGQPQQVPQFQQPAAQTMHQTMQQPNIQPAPTIPQYTQAPPQQAAAAGAGMIYNPNDWVEFTSDDDLPF